MELWCLLKGVPLVTDYTTGKQYCGRIVESFNQTPTPEDYRGWYVMIVFVIVGLLGMLVVFKMIEAKQIIDDADQEILDAAGEVIIQGGHVVKAWKAEKDYNKSEKRIERQFNKIKSSKGVK